MTKSSETWIVVADGVGARVFEEHMRLGPLTERADLTFVSKEDRGQSASPQGTVTDRFGQGRHGTGETDPAGRAEERFLTDLARRIDDAATAGAFEHLVLIAPPTALGFLRGQLKPATAQRIEVSDPHERHTETSEDLRVRLRALRAAH